jgi:hypothetical protein
MRNEMTVPHGPHCVGNYSLILYSMFLLEKLIGPQLFKEYVVFYKRGMFFTVFKRAHH